MKSRLQRPSPALVISLVALFVALGGTAYASGLIPGSKIKNHSIPARKLTRSAIRSLRGQRGAPGPAGAPGPQGVQGPIGPQGPGGNIVTYDAPASSSANFTPLGTFFGDRFSAACLSSGGDAEQEVDLQTQTGDGSWSADFSFQYYFDSGTSSGSDFGFRSSPAGTFSSPHMFARQAADLGDKSNLEESLVQLSPSPGSVVLHLTEDALGTPSCHLSIQSFPETLTSIAGTPKAASRATPWHPFSQPGRRAPAADGAARQAGTVG